MKEKFIPREKLGKRARHEADAAKRRTWDCSPVPRVMESRTCYNRTRENARCREDDR